MAENSKIEWTPEKDGRLIPGYECYCVTPDGRIWTRFKHVGKQPRILGDEWKPKVPCTTKKGHKRVELYSLTQDTRPKKFQVHALVLELFVGPRPAGMEGCHDDGNPANNDVGNLRWDTPRGNWADRKRHGRGCEGEKNTSSKLTSSLVKLARDMRQSGCTLKLIAEHIGVSIPMVSRICRNTAWSHVDG